MQGNGGTMSVDLAGRHAVSTQMSGLAIGSCGLSRPSFGGNVTGTGATSGVPAA